MEDIEKSRHGRYEDNAKNRRLHRVGQEYGSKKQASEEQGTKMIGEVNTFQDLLNITPEKYHAYLKGAREEFLKRKEELVDKFKKEAALHTPEELERAKKRYQDYLKTDPNAGTSKYFFEKLKEIIRNAESGHFDNKRLLADKYMVEMANSYATMSARRQVLTGEKEPQESIKEEKKSEAPTKKEGAGSQEEKETFTRVKFDDMPNSGKVNLKKYLSNKIKASVDKTWKNKDKIGLKTLQDMEKGMVEDFNKNFDTMSKSRRAEALYSIMTVKSELARRGREDEEAQPEKEEPKETALSGKEASAKLVADLERITKLDDIAVDFNDINSIKAGLKHFIPGVKFKNEDGQEKAFVKNYPFGKDIKEGMKIFQFTTLVSDLLDYETGREEKLEQSGLDAFVGISSAVFEKVTEGTLKKQREDAFKAEYEKNIQDIEKDFGIKAGEPMSFEQANQGRGNPKYRSNPMFGVNCQTCVVVHELRLRGFNVWAKGKVTYTQQEMAKDCSLAWIDPATNKSPNITRVTSAPGNSLTRVRKSKQSKKELSININNAMKETGRYNFAYGWQSGGRSAGHIITGVRHPDGKLTFYDPQNGKDVPFTELLDEVSPKYTCRVLRVDNLLIKPLMVKDYAMKYE